MPSPRLTSLKPEPARLRFFCIQIFATEGTGLGHRDFDPGSSNLRVRIRTPEPEFRFRSRFPEFLMPKPSRRDVAIHQGNSLHFVGPEFPPFPLHQCKSVVPKTGIFFATSRPLSVPSASELCALCGQTPLRSPSLALFVPFHRHISPP